MKLVWLLGAALMVGQQQQTPAPIERQLPEAPTLKVESRLVSVALNVTDKQGAPVPGLTKDDFELYEDGKPQRIAVFEKESQTPLDIVIAMDASESLWGELKLERDAARAFVRDLVRPQDHVELMSFADNVTELVPFTSDVRKIDSGMTRMEKGEATAMYDAVYLASQRLAQQPAAGGARRVIVMITDGENTTHHGSYPEALEEAERAGAMVYSLIVVPVEADAGRDTGGEHALIQMSRDTGGKYYEIIDKHDVQPAFARISDDLRTQYTVGYYAPKKLLNDDALRKIELRLKDPAKAAEDALRYRTAYYAR